MLISHDELGEVQDSIESRQVAKQEQPPVCSIEVIVDRSRESLARDDDFRIAPIANFQDNCFRAGKNVRVRKLNNSQRPCGKHVARKGRVGSRSGDGNKITARVFNVRLDPGELARITGEGRIHVRFKITEHGKRTFVIDARVNLRIRRRRFKSCR